MTPLHVARAARRRTGGWLPLVMTGALGVLGLGALGSGCASGRGSGDDAARALNRGMAAQLLAAGDLVRSRAIADRQLQMDPDDAEMLVIRGNVFRRLRMLPEAKADFERALALDDDLATAHCGLAMTLDLERRGDEAEEHHRRAVELAPESAAFLNNLGFSLFVRGKARDAIPYYEKALHFEPMNPTVRNNLGFAYAAAERMAEAAREFEVVGTKAEAKNNLGFAYERGGNLKQAYESYAEAVRLDPGLTRAQENLAHVTRLLERVKEQRP